MTYPDPMNMGRMLGGLLLKFLEGLFWGLVFLALASLLLPDSWFAWLLRRLKPDYTSRKALMGRVKACVDSLLNEKATVVGTLQTGRSREKAIAKLVKERAILQNNLFFLDQVKSLTNMTWFYITRSGSDERLASKMIMSNMDYIQYYTKLLVDCDATGKQSHIVDMCAEEFSRRLTDAQRTPLPETEGLCGEVLRAALKLDASVFDTAMRDQYNVTREQLDRVNQTLANYIMQYTCGDD